MHVTSGTGGTLTPQAAHLETHEECSCPMSEQLQDDSVRQALSSAVASHGISVLSDPQALGDVAGRLMPGMPHARNLLVTAAGANIAPSLLQHLQQHADPAAAIQQAAHELAQRTGLDLASCQWITSAFARALGYPVGAAATQPLPPSEPGFQQPGAPQPGAQQPAYGAPQPGYGTQQYGYGTQQAGYEVQQPGYEVQQPGYEVQQPGYGAQQQSGYGYQQPGYGYQQPAQPSGYQQPAQPSGYQQPAQPSGYQQPEPGGQQPGYGFAPPDAQQPAGQQSGYGYQQPGYQQTAQPSGYQQPGGWPAPPAGMGYQRRSGSRGRTALVSVAVVVVLLLAYVGIAAGTHLFPFARHTTPPSAATSHGKPRPPSAGTSPSEPAGMADLTQLLPSVLDDPSIQCTTLTPPYHWTMTGVVGALACNQVPGLTSGAVYAYQLDSAAHYQAAWAAYNNWWGFDGADAGSSCPPPNATSQATQGYYNQFYPQRAGQVLECEEVSGNEPAYTWTMPSENTFVVAQGAPNSTFAALDSWWTHSATPAAAPTPAP